MQKKEWLVIKTKNENSESFHLVMIKNDRNDVYWGQGLGWASWVDDWEIVEKLGIIPVENEEIKNG